MAITLGTNIPSYTARNNLNSVTSSLVSTMEKLSTGLKINKAGDDSAGLVISENMEALVRGSKQAQANIQNATSFLRVAEDGMVSVTEHLQRINDLLINMANDTNDLNSRTASIEEIIERINEINRLADSTNFNGRQMLGEKKAGEQIIVQMGPDKTNTSILDIAPALSDCRVNALGVDVPGKLHPQGRAKLDANGEIEGKIYVPKELLDATDGTYKTFYVPYDSINTGDKIDEAAYKNLTSVYEPNNKNCRDYMDLVQKAIAQISSQRGLLGAFENRMDSAYESMSIRIESLETARSYYTDTDIAHEATNLTMQQIKQQYNVALLSSANTLPQLALSLIG